MSRTRRRSLGSLGSLGSRLDPFVVGLVLVLAAATLLPPSPSVRGWAGSLAQVAVAVLFFLNGLRISPRRTWEALTAGRLHLLTLGFTFLVLPAVAWALSWLLRGHLTAELAVGLVFLGCLPSVVQTSVVFTGVAGGSTAGAVCAASLSSLVGLVATPALLGLLLGTHLALDAGTVQRIVVQLLLPYLAGQVLHARLGHWASRHGAGLRWLDRGAILLVVYVAFGAAVAGGVWGRIPPTQLATVALACALMLVLALVGAWNLGRLAARDRAERMVVLFCGAEKSLTVGLPLSSVLFAAPLAGVAVLPVIIYHQLQIVVCTVLAGRLGRATPPTQGRPTAGLPSEELLAARTLGA